MMIRESYSSVFSLPPSPPHALTLVGRVSDSCCEGDVLNTLIDTRVWPFFHQYLCSIDFSTVLFGVDVQPHKSLSPLSLCFYGNIHDSDP